MDKIALVLSGGGVKAISHLGLLKVLDEENIEIAKISGCSAGALIGALYSEGHSPDEILRSLKSFSMTDPTKMTFLKPGLLNISKFKNTLSPYFKEDDFSSLKIPTELVSTNMQTGLQVVHKEGKLVESILASCSFPGVFSPVELEDGLHMDGGITGNFPAELTKDYPGPRIGSYACYTGPKVQKSLNSSIKLLVRSTQILLWQSSYRSFEHVDYLFCPKKTTEIGFFDWRKIDWVYNVGYDDARANFAEMIEAIKNKNAML